MDEFKLGTPAVVCRWRLANGKLPLQNRHLRALAARQTKGNVVTTALVAWAKQHLEWTLEDGSAMYPNGVLMLIVDQEGKAAMTVGEYSPLPHTSAKDLVSRARTSWREAERTGVAPEELWIACDDMLVRASSIDFSPSGASSLITDLARTLGMPMRREEDLLDKAMEGGLDGCEVFLVSDEHGVVVAKDRSGFRARKFAQAYAKLLQKR